MIKKLVATAAGIVAGLTLLLPSPALATQGDTGPQDRTVLPGRTVCLQSSGWGYTKARGDLVVRSGHAVRVTLGTPTRVLIDTVTPVFAAGPEVTYYSHPKAFPGPFQLCAINQSLKTSNVTMRVILDGP